jgi:serine protease
MLIVNNPIETLQRQKKITLKMILLLFSVVLLAVGCGGGGGGGDKTLPTVSITSLSTSNYTTTTSPLAISGSASDNVAVVSVTWSSSTGGSGTCTGTTSWTASIPLTVGSNPITITARDRAGNSGTATLTVTLLAPVTLSGTITAPTNTAVDWDVNDTNQTYASNDSFQLAQSIPNPVTLGGYVNTPGTGAAGRSYTNGDVDDFYKVSLAKGDSLVLSIADYTSTDFTNPIDIDLYVYNGSQAIVASSTGTGSSRSIANFSQSGTFYVNVHAVSGASNYVLSIGTQTAVASSGNLSMESEFVPGQVIVRLKDQIINVASIQDLSTRASAMGMRLHGGGPGREILMSFDQTKRVASLQALGVPDDRISIKAVDEKTQKKLDTLLAVKALRKRSDVESADPNYILHAADTVPDDTYYNLQWSLPLINMPLAWDTTKGSNSVIVAVVDTGVLLNHPDLAGKLTAGYDFVSDPSMSNDGDGIDSNPDDPGDKANTGSSSFHGTHVAGIIAASTNNGLGVAGIGWNTLIMPMRALGIGGGTEYDILQAVRYTAGLSNDSGTVPTQKADIINLSLGSESSSSASQAVYAEVRNAGVIVVAAAGNNASSTPFYPASYDGVVSVSAVKINSARASYSNYGANIDVAAPGGDSGDLNGDGYPDYVPSTCGDDSAHILDSSKPIEFNYVFMAGTSMAAPHVAGVAALMKALKPTLTPGDFDAFLSSPTNSIVDDISDSGWDQYYGYGLIDAYKAVQAAINGTVPTVLKVSPTILDFGLTSSSASFTASKIGSGSLSITSVTANTSWLTVTPSANNVDAKGLGTYTAQVNRNNLADGDYSTTITITYNTTVASTTNISVQMQVNKSGVPQDEGYHYVLLIDAATQALVDQVSVQASNGIYTYTFSNEPQGTYQIYAGSDRDNDNYIGDAGEAFGAYQSIDQPSDIVADHNIPSLDFSTSYLVTLSLSLNPSGEDANKSAVFQRQIEKTIKQVKLLPY